MCTCSSFKKACQQDIMLSVSALSMQALNALRSLRPSPAKESLELMVGYVLHRLY